MVSLSESDIGSPSTHQRVRLRKDPIRLSIGFLPLPLLLSRHAHQQRRIQSPMSQGQKEEGIGSCVLLT